MEGNTYSIHAPLVRPGDASFKPLRQQLHDLRVRFGREHERRLPIRVAGNALVLMARFNQVGLKVAKSSDQPQRK